MVPLARAVAGLLVRGGWLAGLVILEVLLFTGFWFSGPTPFGEAFDRRSAEADFLLLTLTTLPALVAGALLTSGDREDGLGEFYRACRVKPWEQVGGTGLGLFVVTAGALGIGLPFSLFVAAPGTLATSSPWMSLGLGLVSTAVHGAWGLALGSWVRSRWAAIAGALLFWVLSVFVLEAVVASLLGALPPRWTYVVLSGFLILDPSQLFRVASVFLRGQGWAYGSAFAPVREALSGGWGLGLLGLLCLGHLVAPLGIATAGWTRRLR